MPLFSVIIAVYNRENLIAATLQSVFAQQHAATGYEVIVVNDGSTDGTNDVVSAFADVQLVQQSNQGAGAARNHGVAKSSGQYLAFLDSDDLWFPWTLATYLSAIAHGDNPAFIAGKPLAFSENVPLQQEPPEVRFQVFADYLRSGDQWRWWGASSFVMRRDAYLESGGFVSGEVSRRINGEDYDLSMRMGVAHRFVQVLSPATFAYREHPANIRKDAGKSIATALFLIDTEAAGNYPGGTQRRRERWRILGRHIRPVILLCLQVGGVSEAWRMYRQTLRWHISLGRVRFLAAFFVMSAVSLVKNGFARPGSTARHNSGK